MPHVPLSHPFVEWLIATVRRELLDHVLFWNTRDLKRKLSDCQAYYNAERVYASLRGNTPLGVSVGETVTRTELDDVRWKSHCCGWSNFQWPLEGEFETDRWFATMLKARSWPERAEQLIDWRRIRYRNPGRPPENSKTAISIIEQSQWAMVER